MNESSLQSVKEKPREFYERKCSMDSLDEKQPILYNHNNVLFQNTCKLKSLRVLPSKWEKRYRNLREIKVEKKRR